MNILSACQPLGAPDCRVCVLIYISWTYVRFLFSLLAAAVFRRVLSVWLRGDKNPHDFYLRDLNLEKHYVICKLFLSRTKLFRRAERSSVFGNRQRAQILTRILFLAASFPQKTHWCNYQTQNKSGTLLYLGIIIIIF